MATYDLLMIAILVGMTLFGYFRGMAWQLAYLASFVASYFVAVKFADQVAPHIPYVTAPANKFVAMLLIYIGTSFVVWYLFRVVRKGIDSVKMEGFDHQMGAIIGIGRGTLWCVGVTFFAVTLPFVPQAWKQQVVGSKSGFYIARLLDETDSLFPPEVHQVVGPYLNRLETELHSGQTGVAPTPQQANGWPNAANSQPAPQAAPSWGQPAAQTPASPGWPTSQPAGRAQPPGAQPATQPSPADFGWPSASAQPVTGSTPSGGPSDTTAQPVSWPHWP
ncbi:CvpA family protein [Botrimarina mediterranea]|uniref:Colicin V production protein n=1 Tax=Botrimarina mediterranea TaxID=2528022 RepID=A0A518KAB4_9BACT|nr:CvpA family protein [Botrimarina mediterranea]QDV74729.1 Colicin V production protein [Botrimarina mediterranea]QDV79361.1 Colicin V production protein [Planctomycetes bacterium K2D]